MLLALPPHLLDFTTLSNGTAPTCTQLLPLLLELSPSLFLPWGLCLSFFPTILLSGSPFFFKCVHIYKLVLHCFCFRLACKEIQLGWTDSNLVSWSSYCIISFFFSLLNLVGQIWTLLMDCERNIVYLHAVRHIIMLYMTNHDVVCVYTAYFGDHNNNSECNAVVFYLCHPCWGWRCYCSRKGPHWKILIPAMFIFYTSYVNVLVLYPLQHNLYSECCFYFYFFFLIVCFVRDF